MKLKAVLFDLDLTLLDRNATFKHFAGEQFDKFFSHQSAVSRERYQSSIMAHGRSSYTTKEEMFVIVCKELSLPVTPDTLATDYKLHYGKTPYLYTDTLETLDILKTRYRLALITNGATVGQNAKITHSGLRPYFDDIRVSETEGVEKPGAEIFERCLQALDLPACECIYVGDHPINDIAGARASGMRAIWIENTRFSKPDAVDGVVSSRRDLVPLLEAL